MIVTPAQLRALFTSFRAEYQAGLKMVDPTYQRIATVVPSTSSSNTYGWLGQFPKLREWIGARQVRDMAAHGYALTNKLYESTVGVKRVDIEDDNIGIYKPLFQEAGRAAAVYPDEHIYALLAAGESTACYDGQNFFDTDHPVYPEVDGTGAPTTVSNVAVGEAEPWYLLDTSRAIKPLIFQERAKPDLRAMVSEDDERVFMEDEYRYGIRARSNVGFGFWQMAYKSTEELTPATFSAAYAAMGKFKADGGRPLGIRPTLLVVGPQLREKAALIAKGDLIDGTSNPNKNLVDVLDTPYLA